MQKLVILGTSGNSLEILEAVLDSHGADTSSRFAVEGFLDDDPNKWGQDILGYPVIGPLSQAHRIDDVKFINGIGSTNSFKRKPEIIAGLGIPDEKFATIIHPSATVSRFAKIGVGTIVLQNAVIGTRVQIGRHVQILPLSVVSHDSQVDDFATIAGGVSVSGYVHLGRACYIGSAAAIRNNVHIGSEALVGMGSVVLNDVAAQTVVAGVPAVERK